MNLTRRSFLVRGGVTAGVACGGALGGFSGRFARRAPVRLGLVGVGGIGRINLERFLVMDGVEVNMICETHAGRAQAARACVASLAGERAACEVTQDYRELCGREDLDAVAVAVPDSLHADVALSAVAAGKAVYGEPPFAHTRGQGRALLRAVAQGGCVWQTGAHLRGEPAFRCAVAAVRAGRIGRVARVEVGLPGGGRGPAGWDGNADGGAYHWRWMSACGGGSLAQGIGHYGDIALWGAGKETELPVSVVGRGEYPRDGVFDTATSFRFLCVYRDGVEVEVADGGRLEKGIGVRWIGEGGEWIWVTRGAIEASACGLLAGLPPEAMRPVDLRRDFIEAVKARRPACAPAAAAFHAAALGQLGDRAMRGV